MIVVQKTQTPVYQPYLIQLSLPPPVPPLGLADLIKWCIDCLPIAAIKHTGKVT